MERPAAPGAAHGDPDDFLTLCPAISSRLAGASSARRAPWWETGSSAGARALVIPVARAPGAPTSARRAGALGMAARRRCSSPPSCARTDPETLRGSPAAARAALAVLAGRARHVALGVWRRSAVFLVMLGSAVPLHVAQPRPTPSALGARSTRRRAEHWRVWLASVAAPRGRRRRRRHRALGLGTEAPNPPAPAIRRSTARACRPPWWSRPSSGRSRSSHRSLCTPEPPFTPFARHVLAASAGSRCQAAR